MLDITTMIVYTKIKKWIINKAFDALEVRAYDGAMISLTLRRVFMAAHLKR